MTTPGSLHLTIGTVRSLVLLGRAAVGGIRAGIGRLLGRSVDDVTNAVGKGGIDLAGQLGHAGEQAAGIVKNTTHIPSASGTATYRIPDVLSRSTRVIGEVKNVGNLSYTNQLRDFAAYAQQQGLRFDLIVRQGTGTQLSGPLQQAVDAGAINLLRNLR